MKTRIFLSAAVFFGFVAGGQAATRTVTNTNDAGSGSLRQTIIEAASGDTITFGLPAHAVITLTTAELFINKNLTIMGPGPNLLTVQRSAAPGTPAFGIFHIWDNNSMGNNFATISGMTIANGNADIGGGIYVGGALALTNATVSGNTAMLGGGIYCDFNSGAFITNCTISGNTAHLGGGGIVALSDTYLRVTNSIISGNTAEGSGAGGLSSGGGGMAMGHEADVIITGATFSGNSASAGNGGAILNVGGRVKIISSTIVSNSANDGGGLGGGGVVDLTIRNTIIALNTAPIGPDVHGSLETEGFNLIGNDKDKAASAIVFSSDHFGTPASPIDPMLGPLQDNGGLTKTRAPLAGSRAIDHGHASGLLTDGRGFARLADDPTLPNEPGGDGSDVGAYEIQVDQLAGCSAISRVVTSNNDSGAGSLRGVIASVCAGSTITFAGNVQGTIALTSGELLIDKNMTIKGPGARALTISGNHTSRVLNVALGATVGISGVTIADGNASGSGGGISNFGPLTLSDCAVLNNAGGSGGGVAASGPFTATNCTFAGNQSTGHGGALRNVSNMTLTNCTITNNTAPTSGAVTSFVNAAPAATLTVTNCTISGNQATGAGAGGGGILNGNLSTATVGNTIIANNTASTGVDVFGPFTSSGYNVIRIGAGSTGFTDGANGDQVGTAGSPKDPSLDTLKNNGGPTDTLALLTGSRAINLGNNANAPAADQRGYRRIAASDIGAFEFGGLPLRIISIARSGGATAIVFEAVKGSTYRLERKAALTDATWQTIPDALEAMPNANGPAPINDPNAVGQAFYRVRLLP